MYIKIVIGIIAILFVGILLAPYIPEIDVTFNIIDFNKPVTEITFGEIVIVMFWHALLSK